MTFSLADQTLVRSHDSKLCSLSLIYNIQYRQTYCISATVYMLLYRKVFRWLIIYYSSHESKTVKVKQCPQLVLASYYRVQFPAESIFLKAYRGTANLSQRTRTFRAEWKNANKKTDSDKTRTYNLPRFIHRTKSFRKCWIIKKSTGTKMNSIWVISYSRNHVDSRLIHAIQFPWRPFSQRLNKFF